MTKKEVEIKIKVKTDNPKDVVEKVREALNNVSSDEYTLSKRVESKAPDIGFRKKD